MLKKLLLMQDCITDIPKFKEEALKKVSFMNKSLDGTLGNKMKVYCDSGDTSFIIEVSTKRTIYINLLNIDKDSINNIDNILNDIICAYNILESSTNYEKQLSLYFETVSSYRNQTKLIGFNYDSKKFKYLSRQLNDNLAEDIDDMIKTDRLLESCDVVLCRKNIYGIDTNKYTYMYSVCNSTPIINPSQQCSSKEHFSLQGIHILKNNYTGKLYYLCNTGDTYRNVKKNKHFIDKIVHTIHNMNNKLAEHEISTLRGLRGLFGVSVYLTDLDLKTVLSTNNSVRYLCIGSCIFDIETFTLRSGVLDKSLFIARLVCMTINDSHLHKNIYFKIVESNVIYDLGVPYVNKIGNKIIITTTFERLYLKSAEVTPDSKNRTTYEILMSLGSRIITCNEIVYMGVYIRYYTVHKKTVHY